MINLPIMSAVEFRISAPLFRTVGLWLQATACLPLAIKTRARQRESGTSFLNLKHELNPPSIQLYILVFEKPVKNNKQKINFLRHIWESKYCSATFWRHFTENPHKNPITCM